ncbi:hypothetical protein H257_11471 [Aphanomyces astaci]|uniref:Uncharacterized protein n=1 Tax=Aphanomyces astaci TaxID=112090 RepID=W4G276_APHAT|nr:hypothetical protein H257_11471 [Aphanomyces astaci]ETV73780.1 hypothetical protein H257_11471 [Aphanomyces astaci]|eukprot:XP_009836716.1 hypothetical protein H257_11471 [Aphanomyces astaci]
MPTSLEEPQSPPLATHAAYFDLSRLPCRLWRSRFSDLHEHSITEYYRQECLLAYYNLHQEPPSHAESEPLGRKRQRLSRRVSFRSATQVMGVADPNVDRRPTSVARVSPVEMQDLILSRVIPPQNQ